jgi:hypothetical protein
MKIVSLIIAAMLLISCDNNSSVKPASTEAINQNQEAVNTTVHKALKKVEKVAVSKDKSVMAKNAQVIVERVAGGTVVAFAQSNTKNVHVHRQNKSFSYRHFNRKIEGAAVYSARGMAAQELNTRSHGEIIVIRNALNQVNPNLHGHG